MIVSFDIDGCVTKHTAQFLFLAHAVRRNGGTVHFVTARPETDRAVTVAQLAALGFDFVEDDSAACLHMYPEYYTFPWTSAEQAAEYYVKHAAFKAAKCTELQVDLHFDDAHDVVTSVVAAGIPTFQVH